MKWLRNIGEAVKTVRAYASQIGIARALHRAEVNMDRLLDRMIEKHPRLGFIDKILPPIEEPLLKKDGLKELPQSLLPKGSEWVRRVAEDAAKLDSRPPPSF